MNSPEQIIFHQWNEDLKPLVSIVCFAYNHELYIRNALESFINQKTNFRVEIIIHDDASKDNTANIIKSYVEQYPNLFNPVYQKVNQRSLELGRVTKMCFNKARGKYIALCEGDDYWTDPLKLQKQVQVLEVNPSYSGCTHLTDIVFEGCKIQNENRFNNRINKTIFHTSDILERTPFHTSSLMFRRGCLKIEEFAHYKLSTDSNYALLVRDLPLMIILSTYGPFLRIPEVMSVYRRNSKGLSENVDIYDVFYKNIEMADALADYLKDFKIKSWYIKGYWHRYLLHNADELFCERFWHFMYFFFSSFYIFPRNIKKILRSLGRLF